MKARRYIVTNKCGPMQLFRYKDEPHPRGGVLLYGNKATVMSYGQARRAIERTNAYALERGYDWDKLHRIVLLEKGGAR